MKKKTDLQKKMPGLKRSVKDFLADEGGFVTKETILQIGLMTTTGVACFLDNAFAEPTTDFHYNNVSSVIDRGGIAHFSVDNTSPAETGKFSAMDPSLGEGCFELEDHFSIHVGTCTMAT